MQFLIRKLKKNLKKNNTIVEYIFKTYHSLSIEVLSKIVANDPMKTNKAT